MPYKVVMDHPKCPTNKPVGLVKRDGGELMGCHADEASAQDQMAAIHAQEAKAMVDSIKGDGSLNDVIAEVTIAFDKAFPKPDGPGPMQTWRYVERVYLDHVIVDEGHGYFSVGYVALNGEYVFDQRASWVPMEMVHGWAPDVDAQVPADMAMKARYLRTPQGWWDELNAEFGFTVDVAAEAKAHLCDNYLSAERSAFEHDWVGVAWCSPPWDEAGLGAWVDRAFEQVTAGKAQQVVMLLPQRPHSDWWTAHFHDVHEVRSVPAGLGFRTIDTNEPARMERATLWILTAASLKTDAEIAFELDTCPRKAIKVLDAATRHIGAYATVWGELDCDGERMTRAAIEPYVLKHNAVPLMFWMHGLTAKFGATPVGAWAPDTFVMDDIGLWVEGDVDRGGLADEAWAKITKARGYGLSVGSLWYMTKRQKASDGKVDIVDWPLLEISIMEGGKQCVPSAQRAVADEGLRTALRAGAVKLGVELEDEADADDGSAESADVRATIVSEDKVDDEARARRIARQAATIAVVLKGEQQ